MSKITLGTAQFGLDYGINNNKGQVSKDEVFKILSAAVDAGVDTLDTAASYGNSEKTIGEFIRQNDKSFNIISKAGAPDGSGIEPVVLASLKELGISSFYGYLIHGLRSYLEMPEMWTELNNLKIAGKIKKIGLSLYSPEELELFLKQAKGIDLVQVPYNILDRRFEPYFPKLKEKKIEINVRSVFLQGIVFKEPEDIEDEIAMLRNKVVKIKNIAKNARLSRGSICLNFVLLNQHIDKMIIGIDGLNNFNEIVGFQGDLGKVKAMADSFIDLSEPNIDKVYQYLIDVYKKKNYLLKKGA